jgi:hypothetical protein
MSNPHVVNLVDRYFVKTANVFCGNLELPSAQLGLDHVIVSRFRNLVDGLSSRFRFPSPSIAPISVLRAVGSRKIDDERREA